MNHETHKAHETKKQGTTNNTNQTNEESFGNWIGGFQDPMSWTYTVSYFRVFRVFRG